MDETQALVIDNGSDLMKVGFGGDDEPRSVFPTITGKSRTKSPMFPMNARVNFVGDEAVSKRGILNLQYPIQKGLVTDWEEMERVWHHSFYNELRATPEEHPVLLTEAPLTPETHREKTAELMFEKFSVPALHIAMQAVLALLETGATTAVVVDSGGGVTHTVPVQQGHAVTHGILQMDLSGSDLTHYLNVLMVERGYTYTTAAEREIFRDVKEKLCYVALDYELEKQKETECPYELPDGNVLSIGTVRFQCPEALFTPSLIGKECIGIHENTFHSIAKCNNEIHKELYSNVVLTGGSTMFDGFSERMTKELTALAPESAKINVVAPAQRKYGAWRGGSMLTSLSSFLNMAVSKEEYNEVGPRVLHSKSS